MCCIVLRAFAAMTFAFLVSPAAIAEEASLPALTYSPWSKLCINDTCFVGRDGANADCGPVVAAVLIERDREAKRTLRVTLPTRVNRDRGVRIAIDQGPAIERPYASCFANGCMADYDAGAELVDRLKQGQMLVLNAIDEANSPITLTLPLAGFANAYDGPRQEPKVFEKVLSKEEMQARLDRQKRDQEERKARCEAR